MFCSSLSSLLWISIFEELPQDALPQGGSQKLKVKSQKFCTRLLQGIGKRTWGQGELGTRRRERLVASSNFCPLASPAPHSPAY